MYEFDLVVGLTGHIGAGKDTFCQHLAPHGFEFMGMGDAIRAAAASLGITETSENYRGQLQDLGDRRKRESCDGGYWAKQLLATAGQRGVKKLIINGIRNPAEVSTLRDGAKLPHCFVLVGITAPTEMRYRRLAARRRAGDQLSLEKFLADDDRDRGIGQPPEGQHTDRCLALVDWPNLYCNGGTPDAFRVWIDEWLVLTAEWQASEDRRHRDESYGQGIR
ncbi:AAA family ATPase [Candidatus Uhrbacteria bacterium]|nr:AAA family ATPase [Candidatus Uhrbacteria bacterium]